MCIVYVGNSLLEHLLSDNNHNEHYCIKCTFFISINGMFQSKEKKNFHFEKEGKKHQPNAVRFDLTRVVMMK